MRQVSPSGQAAQVGPPQSMSVSPPFFWLSLQVGCGVQVLLVHRSLRQSPLTTQGSPSSQPGQEPPQSTAVSLPFFKPSLQLGGGAVHALSTQTSPGQSASRLHSTHMPSSVHTPV